ncbi:centromere protein T [Cololabis saira]|uniref:centromere protein T n=1 Tax=Cololabis saira TaxID=129043 RepID=UPI002AD31C9A|nr:centromere protein T [Cololabis saira]
MDVSEDLSARVLLKHILTTETPRTPVRRSASKDPSTSGIRRSSRQKKRDEVQSPQNILRRSLRHNIRESITRKSLPQGRTSSALLRKSAAPSMLFNDGETPRHLLKNILQTEPRKSPVVHEKGASEEHELPLSDNTVTRSRPSIELSGLDLPDVTFGSVPSTAKVLTRKRPHRSLNVTAFEKRLKVGDDAEVEIESSVGDHSSLSLSSSTSLSLKTPCADVRTEKKGLQRRVSNRRKITQEEFGAAVNRREMGGVSSVALVERDLSETTHSEGFTLGLTKLGESDITGDIVNCNTALYDQPHAMTSNLSICAAQDKSTFMVSQHQKEIRMMDMGDVGQSMLETEQFMSGFLKKGGVVTEAQNNESLSGAQLQEDADEAEPQNLDALGQKEASAFLSISEDEENAAQAPLSNIYNRVESEEREVETEDDGAADFHREDKVDEEEEGVAGSQKEEEEDEEDEDEVEGVAGSQEEEEEEVVEEGVAGSQKEEDEDEVEGVAESQTEEEEEEGAADSQEEEEEEEEEGAAESQMEEEVVEGAADSQEEEEEEEEEGAAESQMEEEEEEGAADSQEEEEEEEEEGAAESQMEEEVVEGAADSQEEEEEEEEEGAAESQMEEDEVEGVAESQTEEEEDEDEVEGVAGSQTEQEVDGAAEFLTEEEEEPAGSQSEVGAAEPQWEDVEAGSQTEEESVLGSPPDKDEEQDGRAKSQTEENEDVTESQTEDDPNWKGDGKNKRPVSEQLERDLKRISQRAHRSMGALIMPVTEMGEDLVKPNAAEHNPEAGKETSFHLSSHLSGHLGEPPPEEAPAQDEEPEEWEDEDDGEESEDLPSKTPAFVREKRNFFLHDHLASPSVIKNIQASGATEELPAVKPKKVRQRKAGPTKGEQVLPKTYLMSHFRHFAKMKVSADVYPVLNETMDKFFGRLTEDLETYAAHAKRKTIEVEDVVLLLKRQGYVNDKVPVEVLIEKYLRMEQRKILIPCATSGNVVIPKRRR